MNLCIMQILLEEIFLDLFEPLLVAAVMYFIMTFTLSKLLGVAERRMRVSDRN